jgi:hypothetical protein
MIRQMQFGLKMMKMVPIEVKKKEKSKEQRGWSEKMMAWLLDCCFVCGKPCSAQCGGNRASYTARPVGTKAERTKMKGTGAKEQEERCDL